MLFGCRLMVKEGDEKVGEIRIEEHPYVTKGFKYEVRMVLSADLPPAFLGDDPDFDWTHYGLPDDFEIWKVGKIEQDHLFVEDRRLLQAFKIVDSQGFKAKFENKPAYVFLLRFDEDVEGWGEGEYRTTKEDVVCDLLRSWLEKEDHMVLTCTARKLQFFPEEKPVVKSRIPITKDMFEKALAKVATKKSK